VPITGGGAAAASAVMITSGHRALRIQARMTGPAGRPAKFGRSLGKLRGDSPGDLAAIDAAHDRGQDPLGPEPLLPGCRTVAENGVGGAADGRLPGVQYVQLGVAEPGLGRRPAQRRQ